ncbi:MAG TPA: adenylosuccinate lyase [Candidatus Coproplasma excrementigallinarum]|uniref:Adenylosuccinate lyase n=1 Tax=Candidatus Coproplasma excrementigallinarum TaxID=2840747 RepID=A0A9D1SIU7_9FIRM|nr:adenylosuccinate lyase [Candidatus Coproplasma excrementigallinarum]
MPDNSVYENPLITRYASREMSENFSDDKRFKLWRKLWIALAESEMELGLNIKKSQIDEMKKYADDINFDVAAKYEREVRHDVMAHVKAFGDQAKSAAPIIHLGATSCFVDCNSELIIIYDALNIIKAKLVNVMDKLRTFALKYKDMPTLGFTHLQPAQLTTVGKRATLWLQDLEMDYNNLTNLFAQFKLRGVKGTTGTQASFMELFDGDEAKVKELENRVVAKMGFEKVYGVTGQTYPRKFDYNVLCVLSQMAQSAYKFSNDVRILQNMKEIEEPFEKSQIGSSAMAYKRNPMRSERMGSLARFVISLPMNSAITAGTQWFERTLDDSANRRIVNAQAFLALDGILNIYMNVSENLVVYDKVIARHIAAELPFMATENIMMECVKAGGNRQELHERIRVLSMEAGRNVKVNGGENNLIELIKKDDMFAAVKDSLDEILDARKFIGRAPSQVVEFISNEIDPILEENKSLLGRKGEVKV